MVGTDGDRWMNSWLARWDGESNPVRSKCFRIEQTSCAGQDLVLGDAVQAGASISFRACCLALRRAAAAGALATAHCWVACRQPRLDGRARVIRRDFSSCQNSHGIQMAVWRTGPPLRNNNLSADTGRQTDSRWNNMVWRG